jgi:uncharacterized membrane protein
MAVIDGTQQTEHSAGTTAAAQAPPTVRTITRGDLRDALSKGMADFSAAPTHVIFLGLMYPLLGFLLARAVFQYNVLPLLFPMVAGFAILGPFAAIGLYEISRLREQGLPVSWRDALEVVRAPGFKSILLLGGVLLALFSVWLGAAHLLYGAIFGDDVPRTLGGFIDQIFDTRRGALLLVLGHLLGAAFAVAAFAISVVSFPLLLDRNVNVGTAIGTSFRAIAANPRVMLEWAVVVAALLMAGSVPLLLGLAVAVPVLGHATWHLYRRVVV